MSEIKQYLSNAPVNVEAIIHCWGIELDKNAELPEGVAGQIRKKQDGGYKISVNKKDHYYRQRFTMAHELGHFMYHTMEMGDLGTMDSVKYKSLDNSNIGDQEEIEANKFGASILMPEDLIIKHALEKKVIIDNKINEDGLKEIAKIFQVSYQAMEFRIKTLKEEITSKLINQNENKNL